MSRKFWPNSTSTQLILLGVVLISAFALGCEGKNEPVLTFTKSNDVDSSYRYKLIAERKWSLRDKKSQQSVIYSARLRVDAIEESVIFDLSLVTPSTCVQWSKKQSLPFLIPISLKSNLVALTISPRDRLKYCDLNIAETPLNLTDETINSGFGVTKRQVFLHTLGNYGDKQREFISDANNIGTNSVFIGVGLLETQIFPLFDVSKREIKGVVIDKFYLQNQAGRPESSANMNADNVVGRGLLLAGEDDKAMLSHFLVFCIYQSKIGRLPLERPTPSPPLTETDRFETLRLSSDLKSNGPEKRNCLEINSGFWALFFTQRSFYERIFEAVSQR